MATSLLVGPLSGVLVASGVYYGFSYMIESRTRQHRADLHVLSNRLKETSARSADAPPPAATRIVRQPFSSTLHARWNQVIASLFTTVREETKEVDRRAVEIGRKLVHGSDSS